MSAVKVFTWRNSIVLKGRTFARLLSHAEMARGKRTKKRLDLTARVYVGFPWYRVGPSK
jgi:hypothetical protein